MLQNVINNNINEDFPINNVIGESYKYIKWLFLMQFSRYNDSTEFIVYYEQCAIGYRRICCTGICPDKFMN